MCDVCVADAALAATRCGSVKCKAFQEGEEVRWSEAPSVPVKRWPGPQPYRKQRPMRGHRPLLRRPAPSVYVRARGKGSEFKPAEYQIRIGEQDWPKKWTKTDDLANPMGLYGFDVKWRFVPKPVRDWVLGLRKMPAEIELRSTPAARRIQALKPTRRFPGRRRVRRAAQK